MKKSPKTCILLLGISSLCMLTMPYFAFANTATINPDLYNNLGLFPLTPRISGLGLAGTNEMVSGDAMAALAGNENGIWWLDGQGKTAFASAWVGSVGTGFRVAQSDKRILGAYVFADRNISASNTEFWFVSPGVESMGQLIDFRINGYIPASSQRKLTGTGFADTFGNYDYVTFQGHQQLDALVNNYEMIGWGIDGEAGIKVPGWRGTRVYVGAYHFDQDQANAINGISARLEYPINEHLALNVRDSYDNTQHNTLEVGLQVNIGGVNKNPRERDQAIRERLLDPVSRNLATLGQGTAEPIGNEQVLVNPDQPLSVERDNIWFFSPTGSDNFSNNAEDCTAENVCASADFNQTTIDGINTVTASSDDANLSGISPNPTFYLAPGNYSHLNNDDPLLLDNDSLWGRSVDFVKPEEATTLTGALTVTGNENYLNDIILQSDGTQDTGIVLTPGSTLTLENSIIGSNTSGLNYHTGIEVDNATLNVLGTNGGRSQIIAYGDDGLPVVGIEGNYIGNYTSTEGWILINHSDVTATSEWAAAPRNSQTSVNQSATALSLSNAPWISINNNSKISATATFNGDQIAGESNMATGIFTNGSTIMIDNSIVAAQAEITGDNYGNNLAVAIGNNSVEGIGASFANNNIAITGSNAVISATALIDSSNIGGNNAAVGIGENLIGTSGAVPLFTGNVITITDSQINSAAHIAVNNEGFDQSDPTLTLSSINMAVGIGANGVDASDGMVQNNQFNLNHVKLISLAEVDKNNLTVDINNNAYAVNMATGIGGNSATNLPPGSDVIPNTSFTDNEIFIQNGSSLDATAKIGENVNFAFNAAAGLGGNSFWGTTNFGGNDITLTNSTATGYANVRTHNDTYNIAVGLGGNAIYASTNYSDNNIILTNSTVTGHAEVGGNSDINFAAGLGSNVVAGAGSFTNNVIQLTNSHANGYAQIVGNSRPYNQAVGLGTNAGGSTANFINNMIILTDNSTANAVAEIGGVNESSNAAVGLGANNSFSNTEFINNTIELTNSTASASASVAKNQIKSASNIAVGLGENIVLSTRSTNFDNNTITLTNSTVSGQAKIGGDNHGLNSATGIGSNAARGGVINFNNNTLTINESSLVASATVMGINESNAVNQAHGLNFINASTGSVTIIDTDVFAQALVGANLGINEAIGLFAADAVSIDMSGGSITTDPNSGQCKVGAGVDINGVAVLNCTQP